MLYWNAIQIWWLHIGRLIEISFYPFSWFLDLYGLLIIDLIFNNSAVGNASTFINQERWLRLRVHDDIIDLWEYIFLCYTPRLFFLTCDQLISRHSNGRRRVVPQFINIMAKALIFLLTLDDKEIFLYFFLEMVGHIGFIDSVVIRLRLDIIEDDVIFLLVDGLQLLLQSPLVRVGLFEDMHDAILLNLLCVRGRDLG